MYTWEFKRLRMLYTEGPLSSYDIAAIERERAQSIGNQMRRLVLSGYVDKSATGIFTLTEKGRRYVLA
jgi:predicted transcriptional regulator